MLPIMFCLWFCVSFFVSELALAAQPSCFPKWQDPKGNPIPWLPVGNAWFTKLQSEGTFYEQVVRCQSIMPGETSIGTIRTKQEQTHVSSNYNQLSAAFSGVGRNEQRFGPYLIKDESATRTTVQFATSYMLEIAKSCERKSLHIETDVTFRILRDDSYHSSKITYWRLDVNKMDEFVFTGGATDHTRVEFDGRYLKCIGPPNGSSPPARCNNLPLGQAVEALVMKVDFNPRAGGFTWDQANGQWIRNRYNLKGSYYRVSCKYSDLYLGGFELGNTGRWFWWSSLSPNRPIAHAYWKTGQPSRSSVEHCLQNTKNGWNDVPCSTKSKALCELRCK